MADIRSYIAIPGGYTLSIENNVYALMNDAFKNRLDTFLHKYAGIQQQEKYPFLPERLIKDFPFVDHAPFKNEIFTRRQDLVLLDALLQPYFSAGKAALEIGGWNGWLTRFLSTQKMEVLTADIFNDENNGLKSKKFHTPNNWLSLQADICDTAIYRQNFDVIVFNHCLQFYPAETLQRYYDLLKPGGMLVILGVSSYGNETIPKQKVEKQKAHYLEKYGFDLYFYDGPGYFSKTFMTALHNNDYNFISYTFPLKSRIIKKIRSEQHGIFYRIKK